MTESRKIESRVTHLRYMCVATLMAVGVSIAGLANRLIVALTVVILFLRSQMHARPNQKTARSVGGPIAAAPRQDC